MTARLSLCANLPRFIALAGMFAYVWGILSGRILLLIVVHFRISVQSTPTSTSNKFLGQKVPWRRKFGLFFKIGEDNYLKPWISNIWFWGFFSVMLSAVDYCRQRIHHRENLFSQFTYFNWCSFVILSLYTGFISHWQSKTCPKDMFVSNTMSNCCSDEQW